MKKFLRTLILIVLLIVSGLVGHFITVLRWGIKEGKISKVYEESRIGEFGSNAFVAYLKEPTDAGIYALKYHLDELDRQERKWGTNWAVLGMRDVSWMRASAHTRLANLYAKIGKSDLSSNHLDAACQAFSDMHARVNGITNRDNLVRYIHEEDQKGSWW